MVPTLIAVHSLTTPCSSCTSSYNESTVNHSQDGKSTINMYPTDELDQYNVSYNPEKPDTVVPSKNISIVRKPITYQTVPRSNKFNKNSNKSRRRTGTLFQPGRTNCNQRTLR